MGDATWYLHLLAASDPQHSLEEREASFQESQKLLLYGDPSAEPPRGILSAKEGKRSPTLLEGANRSVSVGFRTETVSEPDAGGVREPKPDWEGCWVSWIEESLDTQPELPVVEGCANHGVGRGRSLVLRIRTSKTGELRGSSTPPTDDGPLTWQEIHDTLQQLELKPSPIVSFRLEPRPHVRLADPRLLVRLASPKENSDG